MSHLTPRTWLLEQALPLWLDRDIDWQFGGFHEALDMKSAQPVAMAKRSMVQARQIYSMRVALDLGAQPAETLRKAIELGGRFLIEKYSLPSGGIAHAVEHDGKLKDATPDLYAQAFAMFGMANAYRITRDNVLKDRALVLLDYLTTQRGVKGGGFSELKDGKVIYASNPHMHMFEAALAWMEIDPHPRWRTLADDLFTLCREKFIDAETGLLCEYFNEGWTPIREAGPTGPRFMFEPGHQFEWAWLMGRYQKMTGVDAMNVRTRLIDLSERSGINPTRNAAYDELWSDLTIKKATSRFWPQTERIKALAQMKAVRPELARKCDEAMGALMKYFEVAATGSPAGLWYDTWLEDGKFVDQPAKSSSLYHIIGAISEYVTS